MDNTYKNLGFLASHTGSNMQAVIDACKSGKLAAKPSVVISNNSDSEALKRAARAGIPHYHFSSRTHPLSEELDDAILQVLILHEVDLVVLAGYMRKLGSQTLGYYKGRVINIHPALLPEFGGQDMYGINVHRAVLKAVEKETGVTIHLVDENYDQGPILAQTRLPVMPSDTAETLAKRVLETEHKFLVETLDNIISGKITLP